MALAIGIVHRDLADPDAPTSFVPLRESVDKAVSGMVCPLNKRCKLLFAKGIRMLKFALT
jgi:hypothetical protein